MNSNITNVKSYPSCPILLTPQGGSSKKQCLEHKRSYKKDFLPNVLFQHMLSFLSISDQDDLVFISPRFKEVVYQAREKFNWINQFIVFSHPTEEDAYVNDSFIPYINFQKSLNPSQTLTRRQVLAKMLPLIRNIHVVGFRSFTFALESNKNQEFPLKSLHLSFLNAYVNDDNEGNSQIFNLIAQKCPHLTDLNIRGISNFEECQGLSAIFNQHSLSSFSFTAINAEQIKKLNEDLNESVPLLNFEIDCDSEENSDVVEENTICLLSKAPYLRRFVNFHEDMHTDKTYLALAQFSRNLTKINLSSAHFTLNALTVLTQNCRHLTHLTNSQFVNNLVQNKPGEGQEWYKYCPQLTHLQLLGEKIIGLNQFRGQKVYKNEDTQYNTPYIVNMLRHLPNLSYLQINKLVFEDITKFIYTLDIGCIMKNVRTYNKNLKYILNQPAFVDISDPTKIFETTNKYYKFFTMSS